MSKQEGVKMVTYKCPTCGSTVRVVECAKGGTCNGAGKHRQVKMLKVGK